MGYYYGFKPYVPVARRRAQAAKYAAGLAKKEKRQLAPVKIEGRKIASSFWGQAWCDNLEQYSDFANRLPRGRTYVRNGSVIDLQIKPGLVEAIVSGSDIYRVEIEIETLSRPLWTKIKQDCGQSIHSLLDLLQGRFDQGIMQRLTQREEGLFPQPKEIEMECSCPDWAGMCKHIAAVLYGVGARLDAAPEMLFTLRSVDHLELISQAMAADNLEQSLTARGEQSLAGTDLGQMFGIELDQAPAAAKKPRKGRTLPAATTAPAAAESSAAETKKSKRTMRLKKPLKRRAAPAKKTVASGKQLAAARQRQRRAPK
jgi:uncharacterized Zn finger protein